MLWRGSSRRALMRSALFCRAANDAASSNASMTSSRTAATWPGRPASRVGCRDRRPPGRLDPTSESESAPNPRGRGWSPSSKGQCEPTARIGVRRRRRRAGTVGECRCHRAGRSRCRLLPVGADAAEGLYRIVEAAYERKSVAISSNLRSSECVSAISGFESLRFTDKPQVAELTRLALDEGTQELLDSLSVSGG
jgi:hypothetical protein